jgi:hypothetical protein
MTVCELDAGHLKGVLNYGEGCAPRPTYPRLQLMHGYDSYARLTSKLLLAPSE